MQICQGGTRLFHVDQTIRIFWQDASFDLVMDGLPTYPQEAGHPGFSEFLRICQLI